MFPTVVRATVYLFTAHRERACPLFGHRHPFSVSSNFSEPYILTSGANMMLPTLPPCLLRFDEKGDATMPSA